MGNADKACFSRRPGRRRGGWGDTTCVRTQKAPLLPSCPPRLWLSSSSQYPLNAGQLRLPELCQSHSQVSGGSAGAAQLTWPGLPCRHKVELLGQHGLQSRYPTVWANHRPIRSSSQGSDTGPALWGLQSTGPVRAGSRQGRRLRGAGSPVSRAPRSPTPAASNLGVAQRWLSRLVHTLRVGPISSLPENGQTALAALKGCSP